MHSLQGSIWRKWDLHIHTPKSIENNYGGDNEKIWEQFILSLESLPEDVKVIGINDYYFIDGYEKVMDFKFNKGRLKNIEKIFPLLEFRIDTFSSASETNIQKVNLHILFDINDAQWQKDINKIKREFISRISISKLEKYQTKELSIQNFIECGGDLKKGFEGLIPSTESVLKVIQSDTWRKKTFTFLGYKEWDNLEKGNQLKQIKDALYNSVDAFLTASPQDKLSKKQQILDIFGNKPLLYSADIHRFDLFSPQNYQCLTWIKADPTFEGIKQIVYEPLERVKLQNQSPIFSEGKSNIIDDIQIIPDPLNPSTVNWFSSDLIPLNRGLVSIIGEKGAGKTALLDLLAISNGEGIHEQNPAIPYSFYNRAKEQLIGTIVHVNTQAGGKSIYPLTGQTVANFSNKDANVRYLSLKELEGYCDNRDSFQSFMKNIIHSRYQTIGIYEGQSKEYINNIRRLITQLVDAFLKDSRYDECNRLLQKKKNELAFHTQKEPKTKTTISDEDTTLYKQLIQDMHKNSTDIKTCETHISQLTDFNKWLTTCIEQTHIELMNRVTSQFNQLTYKEPELIDNYSIKINSNIEEINLKRISALKKFIIDASLYHEQAEGQLKPLEDKNKNLKQEMEAHTQWITQKTTIQSEIDNYTQELNGLTKNREHIEQLKEQVLDNYKKLLINKINQKKQYEQIKTELQTKENISFDIKIEFSFNNFWTKEDQLINHGAGFSQDQVKINLTKNLLDILSQVDTASTDIDINTIIDYVSKIFDSSFIPTVFGDKKNLGLLKKVNTMEDYYNWLLDDYYQVNYFIKFKSRPLETLSPGQKGLVLMKIFLMLDKDTKPLIIDQPEDNLDNKSVYDDLVNDFKEIKKKRQIIIATHNPNLVVNTDSEQVIVARFEDNPSKTTPRIQYISGALENPTIKNLVCDILEGGDRAFLKREIRYDLSKK